MWLNVNKYKNLYEEENVMKKIVCSTLFFLFLMGCSLAKIRIILPAICRRNKLYKLSSVLIVDCSDEVNKTDNAWGYECPIEVTDETTLEEQSGKKLNFENFSEGSLVEITLTSSIDLMNDAKPFRADKITS